nr:PREDICTED: probable ribosomal protein S11, mitochondrial [Nicotiana tabacum]
MNNLSFIFNPINACYFPRLNLVTGKMKLIRSVLWAANAFKLHSSHHPQAFRTFSAFPNYGIQGKTERKICSNQHSDLGMNVYSPYNAGRRCFIHSESPKEAEMRNNSRPMDFVRGLTEDNTRGILGDAPLSRYHVEQDADIVHIKVLRNNAFVTVTDSKGNKKFGATAGKITGKGTKIARYAAESTAEHVGREARDRGLRFWWPLAVVVHGVGCFPLINLQCI